LCHQGKKRHGLFQIFPGIYVYHLTINLLQNCLDKMGHFKENVTAFIFDDFYISCDLRNHGKEEKPEMDLLIFYCPERYK